MNAREDDKIAKEHESLLGPNAYASDKSRRPRGTQSNAAAIGRSTPQPAARGPSASRPRRRRDPSVDPAAATLNAGTARRRTRTRPTGGFG